jgi:hypothetical protein
VAGRYSGIALSDVLHKSTARAWKRQNCFLPRFSLPAYFQLRATA